MAWEEDLVEIIESAALGTLGTNLFVGPDAKIPQLASGEPTTEISATGGSGPDYTHTRAVSGSTPISQAKKVSYVYPGAALTVRAGTMRAARAKAFALRDALVAVENVTVVTTLGSGWYQWIKPLQEPFPMNADSKGQSIVRFNVLAKKRP